MTTRSDWPYRTSFWISEEPDRAPELSEDIKVDVAIVGGGFAGLSSALHLKKAEPQLDVAVLEAEHCGFGASSRTQGIPAPHAPDGPGVLKSALGVDGMRDFVRMQIKLLSDYERFITAEGIDCDFRRAPVAWIVTADEQWPEIETLTKQYDEAEFPYQLLSLDAARDLVAIPAKGAVQFGPEVRACFHPYNFVRGLRERVLRDGARLFESTPVIEIEAGSPTKLATAGGSVTANWVIIASNAFSGAFPLASSIQTPSHAYNLATVPLLDEQIESLGWARQYSLFNEIDPSLLWISMRLTDRRLLYSMAGQPFTLPGGQINVNENAQAFETVYRSMVARFPFLEGVKIDSAYGAALDMSPTHFPLIGPLPKHPNVIVALGFSGHGIIQSFASGRMMPAFVLGSGSKDEEMEALREVYAKINGTAWKELK